MSAERLNEVLRQAIDDYVPPVYKIHYVPAQAVEEACGSYTQKYRASSEPNVRRGAPGEMVIPCPETPFCLFIGLHEVGHVALRHTGAATNNCTGAERDASEWARAVMEMEGVPVPDDAWEIAQRFWENSEAMCNPLEALLWELYDNTHRNP